MMLKNFLIAFSLSGLSLFGQSEPAVATTEKKQALELGLVNNKGEEVLPAIQSNHHSTSMTVPFVGIKSKIYFKINEEIIKFSPVKIKLGKINPEKGGLTLVKLIKDGDYAMLKGKTLLSFKFDEECLPFKSSDAPKPKQEKDGIWVIEFSTPLPPGIYALASASANSGIPGMTGPTSAGRASIFEVVPPEPQK